MIPHGFCFQKYNFSILIVLIICDYIWLNKAHFYYLLIETIAKSYPIKQL